MKQALSTLEGGSIALKLQYCSCGSHTRRGDGYAAASVEHSSEQALQGRITWRAGKSTSHEAEMEMDDFST